MSVDPSLELPLPVVDTDWLHRHLHHPRLRILDAVVMIPGLERNLIAEHQQRHVPGASLFDIDAVADGEVGLPHMVPTPERFGVMIGAMGIGNENAIVVYDGLGMTAAPRVWWMFRLFGHDRIAVLDGGMPKWETEGRPLSRHSADPVPQLFDVRFRPELLRVADQLAFNLDAAADKVVDARSAGRFSGQEPEIWPGRRSGHIPCSLNLPFTDLIDPDSQTLLEPDDLRRRFAGAGIDLTDPVVATCGSGVTACVIALGAAALGRFDVAVYDGSWAEWGLPSARPVTTGASTVGAPASEADALSITPSVEGDTPHIVALWRECGLVVPWNDPHADIALAKRAGNSDVLVGRVGNRIVASVMVGHDGHRGWLYYLAVAPDRQQGGLGRAMVETAKSWLRDRGIAKLQILIREHNAAVQRFYESVGFNRKPLLFMEHWLDGRTGSPDT